MNLLQMNVSAGILILVIVALRAIAGSTFAKNDVSSPLWMIALFRLILPFSIPSPYGMYTLINRIGAAFLLKLGVSEDNWDTGGLIHRGTEYMVP